MFNLKRSERLSIALLAAILIGGLMTFVYKKSHPGPLVRIGKFDARKDFGPGNADDPLILTEKININEAGVEDFIRLKGVGPTLARRITDYRISHGNFATVEDIKKVKGVGEKLFEKIREGIAVE